MNRNFFCFLMLLSFIGLGSSSYAQSPTFTTTGMKGEEEQTMKDETIGIIPQVGAISFTDKNGEKDGRQLAGLGVDFNFASFYENVMRDYFLGISTGAFYSHIGAAGSDFFGSSDDQNDGGANLLLIPVDAKIGYNFTPSFRASVHGGGNLIYRSKANSARFDAASDGTNDYWSIYPNVGADFELQIGNSVSLIARPDLTIAPDNNLFMATVGATIIMSL